VPSTRVEPAFPRQEIRLQTRRLFLAFWPDQATRSAVERSRAALFPLSGRPVDPAALHVTAAFLGDVAASRIGELRAVAGPVDPFVLRLERLEYWRRPRVLAAVAPSPPAALRAAVDGLWRRLDRLGFAREARPYRAHVTLVRDATALPTRSAWSPVDWPVDSLALVASPGPGGRGGYELLD
jgi:2'-5' RNA ligase